PELLAEQGARDRLRPRRLGVPRGQVRSILASRVRLVRQGIPEGEAAGHQPEPIRGCQDRRHDARGLPPRGAVIPYGSSPAASSPGTTDIVGARVSVLAELPGRLL